MSKRVMVNEQNISRQITTFLSGHGQRCIAVLEVHQASSICVAGYVGNRKEWHSFEKEWSRQLKDYKVSYFHAKDPNSSKLKIPLASAIERRNLYGIVCLVDQKIYNSQTTAQFKSQLGNPYAICAFSCALKICKWAKKNKLGPVTFIYEKEQPNAEIVYRVLEKLAFENDPKYNIAGVGFYSKKDYLPLQTVDFLAHIYATKNQPWKSYLIRANKVIKITKPENK